MKKNVWLVLILALVLAGCAGRRVDTPVEPDPPVEEVFVPEPEPEPVVEPWDTDTAEFIPVDMDSLISANLNTVYFAFDSYDLSDEARTSVITAARFLQQESSLRVRLDGHCDERGSSAYNIALGERRAEAVARVLESYGVDRRRLEIASFGSERPVTFGCADESCHQQNRRTVYTVIKR